MVTLESGQSEGFLNLDPTGFVALISVSFDSRAVSLPVTQLLAGRDARALHKLTCAEAQA